MSSIYQRADLDQGNDLDLVVELEDGNSLTGARVRWKAARENGGTVVLAKDSGAGGSPSEISIDPATAGRFTVHLAAGDSLALAGDYYMEAEVVDSAGKATSVMHGTLAVRPRLI